MGYLTINFSKKLEKVVERHGGADEACDMTSTPGYDNDGCIGPELVDSGVALGFACRDYSPKARIFYAVAHETCFYQFGLTEKDAIDRLMGALEKVDDDHLLDEDGNETE